MRQAASKAIRRAEDGRVFWGAVCSAAAHLSVDVVSVQRGPHTAIQQHALSHAAQRRAGIQADRTVALRSICNRSMLKPLVSGSVAYSDTNEAREAANRENPERTVSPDPRQSLAPRA